MILVLILPYTLAWFGMGGTFWDSVPFEGEVSLVTIVVVVADFAGDALRKSK